MVILLAEDEVLTAMVLETALREAGHDVRGPALTVADGLRIAAAVRPDLALIDIHLKNGDSGVELARALLERWRVRSLFISAQADEARRHKDLALGLIGKPYALETVVRSVELAARILGGQPQGEAPRGLELFQTGPTGSA